MNYKLPLIGVIDLRQGHAVHAIAGKREQYQDVIAADIEPGDAPGLADRYRRLGVAGLYIADLNAICNCDWQTNSATIARLLTIAEQIFIDAGSCATMLAKLWTSNKCVRFILATESCSSVDHWEQMCLAIGGDRVSMGLDLDGNRVRSTSAIDQTDNLFENISPWINRAAGIGVTSIVVLDLAYVGTNAGAGTAETCKCIVDHWPELKLISGGGVRDADDVKRLVEAGCDQVLVATALHNDESARRLFE